MGERKPLGGCKYTAQTKNRPIRKEGAGERLRIPRTGEQEAAASSMSARLSEKPRTCVE